MDEAETMDEGVIEGLFENGLMGIEIPEEFGGAGMGFGAAIVAIEELAKVDPSVSVLCDVHVRLWLPPLSGEAKKLTLKDLT